MAEQSASGGFTVTLVVVLKRAEVETSHQGEEVLGCGQSRHVAFREEEITSPAWAVL